MRVAILIDGGHLRVITRKAKFKYTPAYIEKIALAAVDKDESLQRVMYYDCAPYNGTVKLPVSGEPKEFKGADQWLKDLAKKDLFATRLGILKFRGFKPKKAPVNAGPLGDEDFAPDFEQKGVDMRIGLDIANYCRTGAVDRLMLFSNDSDCIPAMKYARIEGIQMILAVMKDQKVTPEMRHHADYVRSVDWPKS